MSAAVKLHRPEGPRFLTVQEVAERLTVSVSTVRRMVAMGELPSAITLGKRSRRWRAVLIEDAIARLERKAGRS